MRSRNIIWLYSILYCCVSQVQPWPLSLRSQRWASRGGWGSLGRRVAPCAEVGGKRCLGPPADDYILTRPAFWLERQKSLEREEKKIVNLKGWRLLILVNVPLAGLEPRALWWHWQINTKWSFQIIRKDLLIFSMWCAVIWHTALLSHPESLPWKFPSLWQL